MVNVQPHRQFSEAGDSGAVVFDMKGNGCGMVIGGSVGAGKKLIGHEALGMVRVSYIAPMLLVFERIKSVTGKCAQLKVVNLDELANVEDLVRGDLMKPEKGD